MHCRTCEYPLWNLAARSCPECGAAFKPSDFTFVPNSVRFCCPHCRQNYYGTASNGHLVPDRFTCVGCRQAISMDECVILPAEGVADEQTKPEIHPWFEPKRRWRLGAWLGMVWRSMCTPRRQMQSIPSHRSTGFLLAWSVATISVLGASSFIAFFALFRFGGAAPSGARAVRVIGDILQFAIIVLVACGVGLALWIGIAHLMARGRAQTREGWSRTAQAICFTSPALLPMAIPCLGMYALMIVVPWWVIAAGCAIAQAQHIPIWRGILASVLAVMMTGLLGVFALVLWA